MGRFYLIITGIFIVSIPFFSLRLIAQDNLQSTTDQFIEKASLLEAKEDYKEASRYLNEAAMLYWEQKDYPPAIALFKKSILLNTKINNLSGIAKLNSNLAMIYSDLGDHVQSIDYFQQALEYRIAHGEKTEIISTYVNASIALNNIENHKLAAEYLVNALALATEMSDAAQMKSCYGMLAETYEKAGNREKMLHYFNLYKTFHEMVQRNKLAQANKDIEDTKLRAMALELANKEKELALMKASQQIEKKDSTIAIFDEEVKTLYDNNSKQELAIELLEIERQLNEAKIKSVQSENKLQKLFLWLITVCLLAGLLTALFFVRNYRFRKKTGKLLIQQNEKIQTLNENLESQVRKRTHELRDTLKKLEKRNNDLDQFANITSHNLRGPVASILGLGMILKANDQNPNEKEEIIDRMHDAATALDEVIKDLNSILDVKGNNGIAPQQILLDDIMLHELALLSEEIKLKQGKISYNFEAVTHIESVKPFVESIFYNILSNALKYTEEGKCPEITVKSQVIENNIAISFTDNGMGIPKELLGKIFLPYKRFSLAGEGRGLGLYLVKTQLEALEGSIEVQSETGQGTTFTILLPHVIYA